MEWNAGIPADRREEALRLLRAAFEQARRKGKPDWQSMTIAVLKNRLIAETGGAFSEHAFGARNMAEFVAAFPDVVRTNFDRPYPLVTILEAPALPEEPSRRDDGFRRLRPDLWRAIFDYRSGQRYEWDSDKGMAVPATEHGSGLRLPTVSESELDDWRLAFVESVHAGLSDDERAQLDRWRLHRLPTSLLPPTLRPIWNRELTTRGTDRVERWFAENDLPVPGDLTSTIKPPPREPLETAQLRRFIQSCVARMTLAELRQLQLPAAAAARMTVGGDESKPR